MIKVAILGAQGKMGQAITSLLAQTNDIKVVDKIDIDDSVDNLTGVDVAVDFTVFAASQVLVPQIVKQGINVVVGTSGWTADEHKRDLEDLKQVADAKNVNVLIAPNFAIGAVLEKLFAIKAAKYFNSAEIIEMHHNQKLDAPSGTSIDTAQAVAKVMVNKDADATKVGFDARGKDIGGIKIHSVRQPGLLAHQEIAFGAPGERLTIRHDSFSRESFINGVIFAIKNVGDHKGLTIGLENYLN